MRRAPFAGVVSLLLAGLAMGSCASLAGLASSDADAGVADAGDEASATDSPTRIDVGAVPDARGDAVADAGEYGYSARILADQPIGYWRFEEASGTVARDSSIHGHDGTYGAAVVLDQAGLVQQGRAVKMAGALDGGAQNFILVPESPGLEPNAWVTVECWIKVIGQLSDVSLVSYGADNPAPYEPYVLWLNAGAPSAYVVVGGKGVGVAAPNAVGVGETHYLAAVYDGATLGVYVDGALATSTPASGLLGNYDAIYGLGIGSGASATRATFSGLIDEVAIYGVPLTATQITQHYAAGKAP